MSTLDLLFAALAALGAGMVNALVGGGTLISFPVLLAIGLPPVSASCTNTVALTPGYFGGTGAQRSSLDAHRARIPVLVATAVLGGAVGGLLLLVTSDDALRTAVPVLLLVATVLLALQPRLRARLQQRAAAGGHHGSRWLVPAVGIGAVYGGFFGAGLGVMLLAVLGIALDGTLNEANAMKQLLSLATNATAAVLFLFSGRVYWWVALVMAVAAMVGGYTGGRLADKLDAARFRIVVVIAGAVLTVVYAVKVWG